MLTRSGTSLSKAYGLIDRFSEDIDVTVFRDDLGHAATPEALAALSGKKRKAAIEAIQNDCQAYITGPLLEALTQIIDEVDLSRFSSGLFRAMFAMKEIENGKEERRVPPRRG